ncbi:MAG: phenol degradation protein meta, partial [Bradyrhizobium sp.]
MAASTLCATAALADESGTSFWLPGQYGSFAAIAPTPGFSLPTITYYYSGSAGAGQPIQHGGRLELGLEGRFVGQFFVPSYAPDTTILGGRPNFSLAFLPADTSVSASAQLGPFSAAQSESRGGFSDLYPTAQLFWNSGVHNW